MYKQLMKKAVLVSAAIAIVSPTAALAGWRSSHPRRAEVNGRIRNLDRRIGAERREGDLTKAQAHQLRRDDRGIRQGERDMARLDGGHITKADQRVLNQQENVLSKKVGK